MRGVLLYGMAQVPGGLPIPVHLPVPLCAKTAEFDYPGPQIAQGIVTQLIVINMPNTFINERHRNLGISNSPFAQHYSFCSKSENCPQDGHGVF